MWRVRLAKSLCLPLFSAHSLSSRLVNVPYLARHHQRVPLCSGSEVQGADAGQEGGGGGSGEQVDSAARLGASGPAGRESCGPLQHQRHQANQSAAPAG